MDSQTVNPLLTAKIVGSYLRHHTVGTSELPDLIATVHRSLRELGRQPPVEEVLTPAVSVRQSVRPDYVVCLECGYRGRTLRRHIRSRHGLRPGWIFATLGIAARSSIDRPGLFRASIHTGKATRSGAQAKGRCGFATDTSGICHCKCRGTSWTES